MADETTILYAARETRSRAAVVEGEDLWLPLDELARASGWELRPEGACLGEVCVPIPPPQRDRFVRGAGGEMRFNLAALAGHLGMPIVRDAGTATWCFGESAGARAAQLDSLIAPEFSLPDLSGRMHTLSQYRGKKLFLVAWASW